MTEHRHVDGALMISFGAVHPGREQLAIDTFTEMSRFLGERLADGELTAFQPFFFADGAVAGMIGFVLVEGRREVLDDLRRREPFVRLVLRAGAGSSNVRVDALAAGSEAGRLVNLYREVHTELGLL